MTMAYKWTGPNRTTHDGYIWPALGEWTPRKTGKMELCTDTVYHVCTEAQLIYWIGAELYECEYTGKTVADNEKTGVQRARFVRRVETWNDTTARLFACDCAERALASVNNPDPRSVVAIDVARRFALGSATPQELAAAWDAARDAARDAAGDAAGAAAWAAGWAAGWAAAGAAAGAAAWAAAWAAALDAARAAAMAAERAWQTARLMQYIRGAWSPLTLEQAPNGHTANT